MFKSNNLEIEDVISGIRLKNQVKEVGLTISFFEDFLEVTDTESFRLGMDHEKFLDIVKRMLHFEKIFKIKIVVDTRFFTQRYQRIYPSNSRNFESQGKINTTL